MMYKVVLTFASAEEILKFGHSNESYRVILSCGAVYRFVQGGILKCNQFKLKLLGNCFL